MSATARPLLCLLLLGRKGNRCSRATYRHFLQQLPLGMLLQSMEVLLSPVLHHRTSPQAILDDRGASYPALQHSASILTTPVCPFRCLLHFLLLIFSRAPTFCPRRTSRDVDGVSDDRGNSVRTGPPRGSKEHGLRRDKSTKRLERARTASWEVTAGYISPSRQTPTGYTETTGYSGLAFFL
jgi:hypothetical protein